MAHSPPRYRIERWMGTLLKKSSVDKCIFITFVSLLMRFVNAYVIHQATSDLSFSSIVDPKAIAYLERSFWGLTLFWLLMLGWGFLIRKRSPESPFYVTLVLQAVGITGVATSFLTGMYTSPTLLIILGFLVICYMAFPRRFYLPTVATVMSSLVVLCLGERLGLLPYAPLFRQTPYALESRPDATIVFFAILVVLVALLVIGSAFVFNIRLLRAREDELIKQSRTDPLTGIANRRSLLETAERELSRARRHGLPVSCLMIDLDHFKEVNDRFGHPAGDHVLVTVASGLVGLLRQHDYIARYGGEEFVVLLPHTNADQARVVAERCRRKVEGMEWNFKGSQCRITISIGVCNGAGGLPATPDAFIKRADKVLYKAKIRGRNRICVERKKTGSSAHKS